MVTIGCGRTVKPVTFSVLGKDGKDKAVRVRFRTSIRRAAIAFLNLPCGAAFSANRSN